MKNKKIMIIFVAICIVVVSSLLLFVNNSTDEIPEVVFSNFIKTYDHFDDVQPYLKDYIIGVEKAYNKSDKDNLYTFKLDADTEIAGKMLSSFMDLCNDKNDTKDQRLKYLYIFRAFSGISKEVAGINFMIAMSDGNNKFSSPDSFEALKNALDQARTQLSTER